MLAKINDISKNRTGVIEYFLNDERVKNGTAYVLMGNEHFTKHLIKSSRYKQKYMSGGMMFHKKEVTTPEMEQEIMADFESMIFAGLDQSQYNILWVKHEDKGRVELNYIIPRVNLANGKSLDLYSHKKDSPIFKMWQNKINKKYDLRDPHDPAYAQTVEERIEAKLDRYKANPRKKGGFEGSFVLERKNLDVKLSDIVYEDKAITSRAQMIEWLRKQGIEVKPSKKFLSVKHPILGDKALRLKADPIYSEEFKKLEDIDRMKRKLKPKHVIKFHQNTYDKHLRIRAERQFKKFGVKVEVEEIEVAAEMDMSSIQDLISEEIIKDEEVIEIGGDATREHDGDARGVDTTESGRESEGEDDTLEDTLEQYGRTYQKFVSEEGREQRKSDKFGEFIEQAGAIIELIERTNRRLGSILDLIESKSIRLEELKEKAKKKKEDAKFLEKMKEWNAEERGKNNGMDEDIGFDTNR